jgi:hypothetical protein
MRIPSDVSRFKATWKKLAWHLISELAVFQSRNLALCPKRFWNAPENIGKKLQLCKLQIFVVTNIFNPKFVRFGRIVAWDRCYDFLNIFAEIFGENIGTFLLKLLLVFAKKLTITLVFEKNANCFAENWQKSQKIMIITSAPGCRHLKTASHCSGRSGSRRRERRLWNVAKGFRQRQLERPPKGPFARNVTLLSSDLMSPHVVERQN